MPFFKLSVRTEIEVHLTQSKIHVADGTVDLVRPFPPATLIRLYELLKNSRLIDGYRSTTKKPRNLSMPKPLWC
jgi:hypothetical protein